MQYMTVNETDTFNMSAERENKIQVHIFRRQ
jgi:hypothetical protein